MPHQPTANAAPARLDTLTSLRFVAAALVMLGHGATTLTTSRVLSIATACHYAGVAFFFVLSGFVLTWTWRPELARRHFYGRRIARVYPLHAATALLAVAIALWTGTGLSGGPSVANALLVHAWIPTDTYGISLNVVSWSLACEAFFYITFPFLIVFLGRTRPLRAAVGIAVLQVVVAAAVAAALPHEVAEPILYRLPAFRIAEFAIGICLALAVQQGWRPRTTLRTGVLAGIGSYLAATAVTVASLKLGVVPLRGAVGLLVLPGVVTLIAAAAGSDLAGNRGWWSHPAAVAAGDASFALYMVHLLVLDTWLRLIPRPEERFAQVAMLIAYIAAAVVVSLVAFRGFERPLERLLRRRLGNGQPNFSMTAATRSQTPGVRSPETR